MAREIKITWRRAECPRSEGLARGNYDSACGRYKIRKCYHGSGFYFWRLHCGLSGAHLSTAFRLREAREQAAIHALRRAYTEEVNP